MGKVGETKTLKEGEF